MKITEPQPICTSPFEWFEIHADGSVFLCCPAWLQRPIGNLLTQGVDDIWNNPVARELRKSILNGSFHSCSRQRCPYLANRSGPLCPSEQHEDRQVQVAIAASLSTVPYRPRKLNLCFDHSCNLACPSCRREKRLASGADLQRAQKIKTILSSELLPHAEVITLSGYGDPFGSPTYLDLLMELNQACFPRLKQLRLHSNGQLLTERLWRKLPNLHPLISEIEISFDAASVETYRLNRPGGSFPRLLENLAFLSTTGAQLTLSMVVQQNNWREIPSLVALAEKYRAGVYLSQLVNWGTFSKAEYRTRAVHLPEHAENSACRRVFAELAHSDRVQFGNLSDWLAAD